MKRRGKTAHGVQRWQCLICHRTYLWRNALNAQHRSTAHLLQWLKGTTIHDLAKRARCSTRTIRRSIHKTLSIHPGEVTALPDVRYLVMDGTHFKGGRSSAFVVLDARIRRAVYWEYGTRERRHDLVALFQKMNGLGCTPVSATIDGHPAIAQALTRVWPQIRIQRCLVHVQRQGLMWCRMNPKRRDALCLRKLFLRLSDIETQTDAQHLLHDLAAWEDRYGKRLDTEQGRGWVVSDLRRARSMVMKARPFLFCYIDDQRIPRSTNMAEGFFSRFKGLLRSHRGLSPEHQKHAFEWFCTKRR